jgi:hypothetical protein
MSSPIIRRIFGLDRGVEAGFATTVVSASSATQPENSIASSDDIKIEFLIYLPLDIQECRALPILSVSKFAIATGPGPKGSQQ